MQTLLEIFHNPPQGSAWKWPHYIPIYERHFAALRSRPVRFLEIGVFDGGSLWMWKKYFENSRVIGLDINPDAKRHEGDGVEIRIGDQADAGFLSEVARELGPFDIVLDDGGHEWNQQIISLTTLFPHVNDGGLYLIEDLHSSYSRNRSLRKRLERLRQGYPRPMEFLKGIIDAMNFRHHDRKDPLFSESVSGISFYEGMVVIEKGRVDVQPAIRSRQTFDESRQEWVENDPA